MATVSLQSENAALRVRTGVGMAGMFVVACFGAALFFTGAQSQASDELAGGHSQTTHISQVAAAQ